MELLGTIMQILLIVYLLGGLSVSIYSLIVSRNLQRKPLFGVKFFNHYYFYSGAFFAIWLMLMLGLEELLFFVPDSWGGYDEYGEWSSAKEHWSTMISLFLTGLAFWYIGKSEEVKKNKDEDSIFS